MMQPLALPVLDVDFDDDREFEACVLSSIERCGTIDVHPNAWGAHDGIAVYSDGFPEDSRTPEERRRHKEYAARKRQDRAQQMRAVLEAANIRRRRLERQLRYDYRENLRQVWLRFLIAQNQWTRSALRDALEPVVMRAALCDRIAAVCAINEFMDFGWKEVERAGGKGRLKWLVATIRSYRF